MAGVAKLRRVRDSRAEEEEEEDEEEGSAEDQELVSSFAAEFRC